MFDGYLLYGQSSTSGQYIPFPHEFIKKDSVFISPELRTELQAWRDNNNYLHRKTSPNRKSDLRFTLIPTTYEEMKTIQNWFSNCVSNIQEAKLTLRLYKPDKDNYFDIGFVYKVDETYNISKIVNGKPYYNEMEIEFIQY